MNFPTDTSYFCDSAVDQGILRQTAFNLRWATVANDVIPLTAGEMDFPVAPPVREAIDRHVRNGYLGYCPAQGFESFREAIAADMTRRGISSSADNILALDGAASALKATCLAVLDPGDVAITFDPVDFLLPHCVELAGATALRCPVSPTTGKPDLSKLDSMITPATKALVICNPHNPTGRVLRRAELISIADLAEKNDLIIISDEVWSEIVLGPIPMTSIASLSPEIGLRTVTISGFSKSDGLSGLRVGYAHCENKALFSKIMTASGALDTTGGATVLSQIAAEAALLEGRDWRNDFIAHLKKVVSIAVNRLSSLPGVECPMPEGTFLLFPKVTAFGLNSSELAELILKEAKVSVVPGDPRWFGPGSEGHLRFSVATSCEILNEALNRIETFWNQRA